MIYYLLGIILFTILAAIILSRWRWGVIFVFVWLLLEDLIRRLVPGQPAGITLIKDIILFITYFSFFAWIVIKNKKIWRPPFIIPLLLFTGFVLINVFNSQAPNLFFGLVGLRSYLWYLPLIFLGYYMFNKEEQLLKFCRILVYTSIPLFVLAASQYLFYGSGGALIRPFSTSSQVHAQEFGLSPVSLLSSVFGTAHRYGRFSILLFFLGFGLLMVNYNPPLSTSKKNKVLLFISTACAFLGIFMSNVRTAFILTVIGAILFFVFATYIKNSQIYYLWKNNRIWVFSLIAIILVALPIIFLFGNSVFFQISAFYFVFQHRIPWVIEEFSKDFSEAKLFGNGTGTMSQGINYIPGGNEWIKQVEYQTSKSRAGFGVETGIGKVLFELGIAGLLLFYLFWANLFYRMIQEIKKLKISPFRNLAVAIFIFSLLMLVWFSFLHNQVLGDATTLVILWFFIGIFFGLRKSNREYTN